ncbi:hypothetical protein BKA12_000494 [Neomicrococcus lactis]|uniref:Uncharacterized protein n=1 Tax=Neomicrococcus lactis TaxID=732241 RepID=A0A7W8Y9H6_9MICC|nr:hypothetical protein [Neomicrococcus lactis]
MSLAVLNHSAPTARPPVIDFRGMRVGSMT